MRGGRPLEVQFKGRDPLVNDCVRTAPGWHADPDGRTTASRTTTTTTNAGSVGHDGTGCGEYHGAWQTVHPEWSCCGRAVVIPAATLDIRRSDRQSERARLGGWVGLGLTRESQVAFLTRVGAKRKQTEQNQLHSTSAAVPWYGDNDDFFCYVTGNNPTETDTVQQGVRTYVFPP